MTETAFKGSKIIRLKRNNLWDRYKSLLKAQETAVWHARDADQVDKKKTKLHVPVQKMIDHMLWKERADIAADEWARHLASEVLEVDYEECKSSPNACRSRMLSFLGVDDTDPSMNKAKTTGILAFAKSGDPLEGIENREEVIEALGSSGFGSFIGLNDHTQLQLLIYETEQLEATSSAAQHVRRANRMGMGINVTCVSYVDQVDIGVAIEPQLVPDPWPIIDGMQSALDEYLRLAGRPARRRKSSRAISVKRSTEKTAARKKANTTTKAAAGKKAAVKRKAPVTASKASGKPKSV